MSSHRSGFHASRYQWDPRLQRYVDPATSRMVSRQAVRTELDKALQNSRQQAKALAGQLQAGAINLQQFRSGMATVVKDVNCIGAATAKGGWGQMSAADWGRVGPEVKEQLQYLNRFTQDIAAGKVPLDGRFLNRAGQYSQTGRATEEKTARREAVNRGANEARRVLGQADHCGGCVEQDALGWRPVADVPGIGTQDCRHNCKCHIEYRVAPPKDK